MHTKVQRTHCKRLVGLILQRIPLSDLTRKEINELVQELGFYRKEAVDSPVPEEFQLAPSRPPPSSEEVKADHMASLKGSDAGEL